MIWIIGIIAMLTYSFISLIKLKKSLKYSLSYCDNIYLADNLKSPFVMGFFRPKIYLPGNLTKEEKEYIILHEQMHIKRFDHIIKLISFLILCVHWFNPLVWVAFFISGKDMEMSCDESVIKKLGNDVKKDYSTSLLSLATGKRIIGGIPLAFGEGNTKSRIKNILSYKKPAFWVIIVCIIAVIAVCVGLMTNPKDKKAGEKINLSDISEMNIGAEMPDIIYSDDSKAVLTGTFGVLEYSFENKEIINRLSYDKLKKLGIDFLNAQVSFDGKTVYLQNVYPPDGTTSDFYYIYNTQTKTIDKHSGKPEDEMFKRSIIEECAGSNYEIDKYLDLTYLIGLLNNYKENEGLLYTRAEQDWSMQSLEIVIYNYSTKTNKIYGVFNGEYKEKIVDETDYTQIETEQTTAEKNDTENKDKEIQVMTTDNAPIGCEFSRHPGTYETINRSNAFSELRSMSGFSFNDNYHVEQLELISTNNEFEITGGKILDESTTACDYNLLNSDGTIFVPEDTLGTFIYFVEIKWEDNEREVICFSVKIIKHDNISEVMEVFEKNEKEKIKTEIGDMGLTTIVPFEADLNGDGQNEVGLVYDNYKTSSAILYKYENGQWTSFYTLDGLPLIYCYYEVPYDYVYSINYKYNNDKTQIDWVRTNENIVGDEYTFYYYVTFTKGLTSNGVEISTPWSARSKEGTTYFNTNYGNSQEITRDEFKKMTREIEDSYDHQGSVEIQQINKSKTDNSSAIKTAESDVINKNGKAYNITFPAYQEGRQDYNAFIYDHDPFNVNITLPDGWSVHLPPESERGDALLFTPVYMYKDDKYMGYIGFNTFELYEGTTEENFYRSVYNQLMLGSVVSWDCDYTPVVEDDNFCSATCKVMQKNPKPGECMAEAETLYFPAILAYNKDLLVYTAIQFQLNAVTPEQQNEIAKSINFIKIDNIN